MTLDRARELIAQQRAQREQSVTGNGHGLAMLAASSGASAGAAVAHRLRGLAGIHYLKSLDAISSDARSLARPGPLPMRPGEIVNALTEEA